MELRALVIPETFEELVEYYKTFRKRIYSGWRDMHYNELKNARTQASTQINAILRSRDPQKAIKACFGIRLLGKLHPLHLEELLRTISNLLPCEDDLSAEFISYILAKFCRTHYLKELRFIIDELVRCDEWLKEDPPSFKSNNALHMLNWFAQFASSAILSSSQQFLDTLSTGFFHESSSIRLKSRNIAIIFYERSQKGPLIKSIYEKALKYIYSDNMSQIHGAILVILTYVEYHPHIVSEDTDSLLQRSSELINNEDKQIFHAAFRLLIALATLNPILFRTNHLETVTEIFWKEANPDLELASCMIPFIQYFPECLANDAHRILSTLGDLFSSQNDEIIHISFQILKTFSEFMTSEFITHFPEISSIICSAPVTLDFLEVVPPLFSNFPALWAIAQEELGKVFIDSLNISPTPIVLRILASCPSFASDQMTILFDLVKPLLVHRDSEIRQHTTAALMNLNNDIYSESYSELLHDILSLVVSETNTQVRISILESLQNPPYSPYLAFPSSLDLLSILTNDESFRVRQLAMTMIGNLVDSNPALILPTLRRVILDSLFISDSSPILRLQAQTTHFLKFIFESAGPLLPIYGPVFYPIALNYLTTRFISTPVEEAPSTDAFVHFAQFPSSFSFHDQPDLRPNIRQRGTQLTFFEQKYSTYSCVNLIDTLALTCQKQPFLLQEKYTELSHLYLDILTQNIDKMIVVSVLKALNVIIDYIGPNVINEFPTLLPTVISIGTKYSSWKVHSVIFKFYGNLGPIMPEQVQETFSLKQEETSVFDVNAIGTQISLFEWNLSIAAVVLLNILEDDSRAPFHFPALQILTNILQEKYIIIQPYFNRYLLHFLDALHACASDEKEQYFILLDQILRQHSSWLMPFASQFARLINEVRDSIFIMQALDLIPIIATKLGASFSPYLSHIVAELLDNLFNTEITQPRIACAVLATLAALTPFVGDYVFIILKQTVDVIFNPMTSETVILAAVNALITLVKHYNCASYSSIIVRSCFQCFQSKNEPLRKCAVDLLLTLSHSLGSGYEVYAKRANMQLQASGLLTDEIIEMFNQSNEPVNESKEEENNQEEIESIETEQEIKEEDLLAACTCESVSTPGQWKDWFRHLMIVLIQQSPSIPIRACYPLAQSSNSFAFRLFQSAFLSCWIKLSEETQTGICDSLSKVLTENSAPISILTSLVGLAEFMERTDHRLPISYSLLANASLRAEKLPFALYCAQNDPKLVPLLLQIYSQLAMDDDIHGLIQSLRSSDNIKMTPKLAEQLGDWNTAIQLYKQDESNEGFIGLLASYSMLNDWDSIVQEYNRFENLPATFKKQSAEYFANAFYHFKDWKRFDNTIRYCPPDSVDALIIQSIANHDRGLDYSEHIQNAFDSLGRNCGPLFPHGFSSLIPFLVQAEQLVELQEREDVRNERWIIRQKNAHLPFQQTQPLLCMRIWLLGPSQAENEILILLKLARNSNEWGLYDHFFKLFYPDFTLEKSKPHVVFEHIVSLWKRQDKEEALVLINQLIKRLFKEDPLLNDRALYTKARWTVRADVEKDSTALKKAALACKMIKNANRKTIHFYAWTQLRLYNMREGDRKQLAINAIRGFILSAEGISEMMQLCSIVFRSGKFPDVFETVKNDLENIRTELWLPIIPQLFAQISNPITVLAEFARNVIWRCLIEHHHVVIFSLLFCSEFGCESSDIGQEMLQNFAKLQPDLVIKSQMMYHGLLSACVTKAENWAEALNIAAEYYKQGKYNEMKVVIEQIYSTLRTRNSDADFLFNKIFNDRLIQMQTALKRFFVTKNKREFDSISNEYRSICAALKAENESMASIPIRFIAPKLADLEDVNVAVPGTYEVGKPVISVKKFEGSLDVFQSKQRPKRIAIIGSNGDEYWFLLKGHEDLRLDQRVVQLFTLINTFIPHRMPRIITNFILPLSPSVGLIQWIPGCDTMFKMIREYRTEKDIPIDIESRLIVSKTIQRFDDLMAIQRMEAMLEVAEETPDNVLSNILWKKAPDAEAWVQRVTTFSKTSALMSVVGYILGLGDRHPSNIMVHKFTGSVIHVDFADCFEAAKDRLLFPELIPFRLTRFMIRAFGPSGVDGSFRKTCMDMIKLIRGRREGIMSVLEIFAHAPIVRNVRSDIKPNRNAMLNQTSSFPNIKQEIEQTDNNDEEDLSKKICRISDKINGKDFGFNQRLTQQEQVVQLINSATDMYNMAHLYHGWNPLW